MAPLGENLEAVGRLPIGELMAAAVDACFFKDFADGGIDECFVIFPAASDGLPIAWVGGPFEQENLKCWRVDNNQG